MTDYYPTEKDLKRAQRWGVVVAVLITLTIAVMVYTVAPYI